MGRFYRRWIGCLILCCFPFVLDGCAVMGVYKLVRSDNYKVYSRYDNQECELVWYASAEDYVEESYDCGVVVRHYERRQISDDVMLAKKKK